MLQVTSKFLIHKNFILVVFLLSVIVGLLSFNRFSAEDIKSFGYTPEFIDIADTTISQGSYTSHLTYSNYYFDKSLENKDEIVPQVSREPLYPLMLVITKTLGFDYWAIVYIQLIALILTYFIWGVISLKLLGRKQAVILLLILLFTPLIPFYSSIIYPFVFQMLALTLSIALLLLANRRKRKWYFLISGVFLGLSCYERGAYLFLPIFIIVGLFLYRLRSKLSLKLILIFLLGFVLTVFPWLVRNLQYGTVGMNQLSGYTLGYTYGNLKSHVTNQNQLDYDANVKAFGTDAGTIGYINYKVLKTGATYAQVDKEVTDIVKEKMLSNLGDVIKIVVNNLYKYPSDLGNLTMPNLYLDTPKQVYINSIMLKEPTILDVGIFILGFIGIILLIKRKYILGYLAISILIYNILFSTLIVIFDPRYRNLTDILLYVGAIYLLMIAINKVIVKINDHK